MTHPTLAPALVSLAALIVAGRVLAKDPTTPGRARIELIAWNGWPEAYRLSNGTIELVVVPACARILHYGFVGEENLLWRNASASGKAVTSGSWTNYGGSKTWVWPQDDWPAQTGSGWPPPTDLPTTIGNAAEIVDMRTLRLTSPALVGFDAILIREIRIEDSGTRVLVTSRLRKIGADATFALAPWTVTQMPADGALYARLLPHARPAGGFRAFSGSFASVSLEKPDILCVERLQKAGGKIGMDADLLAWQRDGVLFVERSIDDTPLTGFAAGDRGQFYSHPDGDPTLPAGISYIEMELTAPLATLKRGESAVLETTWELVRLGPAERTRQAVAARLRKM